MGTGLQPGVLQGLEHHRVQLSEVSTSLRHLLGGDELRLRINGHQRVVRLLVGAALRHDAGIRVREIPLRLRLGLCLLGRLT